MKRIFILVFLSFLFFSCTKEYQKEQKNTKLEGIGISRQQMINVLNKPEIGFSFVEGTPIEGQSNFVGQRNGNVVQLIGPEDNLTEASITALINWESKNEDIVLNMIMVVGFANIIDESSYNWIVTEYEKFCKTPQNEYNNYKIFSENRFDISYAPVGLTAFFSLTVKPTSTN